MCWRVGGKRDIPVEALFPESGGCLELACSSGCARVLGIDAIGGAPHGDFTDKGGARVASRWCPVWLGVALEGVILDLVGEVCDQWGSLLPARRSPGSGGRSPACGRATVRSTSQKVILWAQSLPQYRQNGTAGNDQDPYKTTAKFSDLHTAVIEWKPNFCRFILDGKIIGTSTSRDPNTPDALGSSVGDEAVSTYIKAENGEIISDAAEGYRHKGYAVTMAEKLNPNAELVIDEAPG